MLYYNMEILYEEKVNFFYNLKFLYLKYMFFLIYLLNFMF